MRLAPALGALAALALAAPAYAQEPAPNVVRFTPNDFTPINRDGAVFTDNCSSQVSRLGGWDGGPFLPLACGFVRIDFPQQRQAIVELFVRAPSGGGVIARACRQAGEFCGEIVSREISGTTAWTPVVLAEPEGAAEIDFVEVFGQSENTAWIDDVSFSPVLQPGTVITSAPTTLVEGQTGEITFTSSAPGAAFFCSVDGAQSAACASPLAVAGVGVGQHTVRVTSIDIYGSPDRSPASVTFSVVPAPVEPLPAPLPDADLDSIRDSIDNCPFAANTDQADADADAVGNACEVLPAGNVPPVAGVNTVVRQISGEVFVKLPVPRRLGFDGMRAPFQESGFVSLKGVASVPVGSTVDTRKGEIGLDSAANAFPSADRRARRHSARIKAGLFAIKQARAKRRAARAARIPMDIDLLSPPRAEAGCVRGPAKGVVRTMSMTAKGFVRALGGASTATARDATFNTTDRCDGTLTEVGRGRVTLAVKGRRKPITVRAGGAYLVRAKIFAVRKGRRPGLR